MTFFDFIDKHFHEIGGAMVVAMFMVYLVIVKRS